MLVQRFFPLLQYSQDPSGSNGAPQLGQFWLSKLSESGSDLFCAGNIAYSINHRIAVATIAAPSHFVTHKNTIPSRITTMIKQPPLEEFVCFELILASPSVLTY